MAQTLNKVLLIGYVGRDAEVKYTNTGMAVMRFSLATDSNQKDINGNWQRVTTWHDIVCFNKLAENLKDYVKKGRKIYVEGRLWKRDYIDKQNIRRFIVEVVADNLILLDKSVSTEDTSDVETPAIDTETPPVDLSDQTLNSEELNKADKSQEEELPF